MNQIEVNTQITPVYCDKSNHQNELIRILCLRAQCQENSAFCFLCSIKGHLQCRQEMKLHQDVPQLLTEIQQLKVDVLALQEKFKQQFESTLSSIELMVVPITQYYDTPNLTNLNKIGKMLRGFNRQEFIESFITSMKTMITNFENKQNLESTQASDSNQQPQQSQKLNRRKN